VAGITLDPQRRGQLSAIANLRWRMFVNRLRTKRGKLELVSRIIVTSAFALGGLGGCVLAAVSSWIFVSHGEPEYLAIGAWSICFFWQVFPVMATAFTNNPDSSDLLRFPLTYRSYFLIRLAYGFFDPACALGSFALFGMLIGITVASPWLFPWALLALATFAIFNLVLMQTVFAWLERWLAQRRTREIMGVVFILVMVSFQLIGPVMGSLEGRSHPEYRHAAELVNQAQAVLPPGLAADAIAQPARSEYMVGLTSLLFLAALTLAVGYFLHLRLSRQFRGENLSEAAARPVTAPVQGLQVGWSVPGLSQSVSAVFEKEVRYLARSGPMLLTLVMPIIMLVIFRLGPMNPARQTSFLSRSPDMAFPGAAAYALLVLTNLLYNSFGGDGGGVQFFYAAPITFRQVVMGKNLTHAGILAANMLMAWITVSYLYGIPRLGVTFATLAGLLFAAPLTFTAGNLLSLYYPKKRDFATFGRQNVSQVTLLASLGVQIVVVGVGVAAFTIARLYHNLWIAALVFLALSAISIPMYVLVLGRLNRVAAERRETLMAELCRA
jgi:ABC-2 type transport system permease protein